MILQRKPRIQLEEYNVLHLEPARDIKSLDIFLRHPGVLEALHKEGKGKNFGKRQRKRRANVLVEGSQNEGVAPGQ